MRRGFEALSLAAVLALVAGGVVVAVNYNLSAEQQCGVAPSGSGSPSSSPSGELCITSPPDNSIVSISDPNFVEGADIGPNDRAPNLNVLKLKVSGTSTCPGPVTVNGFRANPSSGDWTAKIPLRALATGGVGRVTLTAKAGGCSDVSSSVTLILMTITNPDHDGVAEPITNKPAMPDLNAKVRVIGYPGDTSSTSFGWKLDLRNETVARSGKSGVWSPDSVTITGSTTGTGQAWQPGSDTIVGGIGRLSVSASLPGVLGGTVTSFPRWINVPGGPLGMAIVLSYIEQSQDAQHANTISQIFCVESRWQQFNSSAVNSVSMNFPPQPRIPNVPADWTPNPPRWQPIYGGPAGIGVAQLDLEGGTLPLADYWNWHTNVNDGIALFDGNLEAAPGLVDEEQIRLTDRRNAAIAIATANRMRRHDHTPLTPPPLITVPPLSDLEILWQAVKLYNTNVFDEFHFNADYIVSANGLNVLLVGTDTPAAGGWEGAADLPGLFPGVPSSPAGSWLGLGIHRRAMQWQPEPDSNQTYDGQVRTCREHG